MGVHILEEKARHGGSDRTLIMDQGKADNRKAASYLRRKRLFGIIQRALLPGPSGSEALILGSHRAATLLIPFLFPPNTTTAPMVGDRYG